MLRYQSKLRAQPKDAETPKKGQKPSVLGLGNRGSVGSTPHPAWRKQHGAPPRLWRSMRAAHTPFHPITSPPNTKKPPGWVIRGTGVHQDERRVFTGVGSAAKLKDQRLMLDVAKKRAQAELQKVLDVFFASVSRDRTDRFTQRSTEELAAEKALEGGFARWFKAPRKHVKQTERWSSSKGRLYALATLELDAVLRELDAIEVFDEAQRSWLKRRAEKEFASLLIEQQPRAPR